MTIKAERHLYVQCDLCEAEHPERSLSTYGARVKAGADRWELSEERDADGKLTKLDVCPECARGAADGQVQRGVPQGSDEGATAEEAG